MLCNKCYKSLQDNLVGAKLENGDITDRVSLLPDNMISFTQNFMPIYITFKKEVKRGKNKGIKKTYKEIRLFKTKFCPICGEKMEDEKLI